jgi:hypothetical protein
MRIQGFKYLFVMHLPLQSCSAFTSILFVGIEPRKPRCSRLQLVNIDVRARIIGPRS